MVQGLLKGETADKMSMSSDKLLEVAMEKWFYFSDILY